MCQFHSPSNVLVFLAGLFLIFCKFRARLHFIPLFLFVDIHECVVHSFLESNYFDIDIAYTNFSFHRRKEERKKKKEKRTNTMMKEMKISEKKFHFRDSSSTTSSSRRLGNTPFFSRLFNSLDDAAQESAFFFFWTWSFECYSNNCSWLLYVFLKKHDVRKVKKVISPKLKSSSSTYITE